MTVTDSPSIALIGGSFNPPHNGHFRIGIEVYEALSPQRVEFIPSANPPHKHSPWLLPLPMRVQMLEQACSGLDFLQVNPLEGERDGPSFTRDILLECARHNPGYSLYFVLGAEIFSRFLRWKDWDKIPEIANILVVSREGMGEGVFCSLVQQFWPEAVQEHGSADTHGAAGSRCTFLLPCKKHITFLPVTRMDSSSSQIREAWLQGKAIDFLCPESVVSFLDDHRECIRTHWALAKNGVKYSR